MARHILFVFIAVAALVGPAAATAQDRPRRQVLNDISREVNRYTRFTIFDDVNAEVDGKVVTLTGKVTMPYKRTDIERRVAGVRGVSEVHNKIEVLPASTFDDELRFRIARAIYGHPSFWQYASMANPPIHIVVDRGRVTLSGVVNSEVQRMLARSLATQFGAFSVTSQLRTDAEVKQMLDRLD